MKKKDIITIIIIVAVLAWLVFGAIFLASRHRVSTGEKKILGIVGSIQIRNNSAYISCQPNSNFAHDRLMRFDIESESLEILCQDENCNTCALDNINSVSRIYLNKLYFQFSGKPSGYAYYDITSGETHIIKEYEGLYCNFFVYNDYIYHMLNIHETEKPKVYRVSPNGKETTLLHLEEYERLIMVADGMIITEKTFADNYSLATNAYSVIYAYDIDTLERRELWQSAKNGINAVGLSCKYYNGRLYFYTLTEYTATGYINCYAYLYCLDTLTGEATKISDDYLGAYFLNEDGLYFLSTDSSVKDKDENGEPLTRHYYSVWKTDLSGNNKQKFASFNSIYPISSLNISGGKIFGQCFMHTMIGYNYFYYVVDVQSGEFKTIKIPT